MQFDVLGPLEVHRAGARIEIGPPKRRMLLLRLLLEQGRTMSAGRLCDDLWDGSPPTGALSSLHAHISRLRAVLEPERGPRGTAHLLTGGHTGYALRVPQEVVDAGDAARFERATDRARQLAGADRPRQALREVDRALALWRGAPFADAADRWFAAQETARLEGLRLTAEEIRATALLQLGEHDRATAAAEALTRRNPLREASWALLMRALYLSGRAAEALGRYESVRTRLAEELGADPSPVLRDTQLAVLRHDTAFLTAAQASPAVRSRGSVRLPGQVTPRLSGRVLPHESAQVPEHALPRVSSPMPAGTPLPVRPGLLRSATDGQTGRRTDGQPDGRTGSRTDGGTNGRAARSAAGRLPDPAAAGRTAAGPVAGLFPSPPPLVGRDAELTRLQALLRTAAAGRTAWAAVVGEPGSGKSRLAEEFAARAAAAGFAVVFERCGRARHCAPGGSVVPGSVDRPTLWVVEDVQRAGHAFHSLLTAHAEAHREAPLVVLCTLDDRERTDPEEPAAALVRAGAELMVLHPLSVADIQELLRHRSGVPEGVREGVLGLEAAALHQRSGGNAFLVSELLKLPAGRRSGPAAELPVAASGVLRAQLTGLGADARDLLETAAVSGEELDIELLAHVLTTPVERLLRLVDEAVGAGLLSWRDAASPEQPGRFGFVHGLAREVVRADLGPGRRQTLHAAVARSMMALSGHDATSIAHHLIAASALTPRARIAEAALRAGRRCAEQCLHEEAVRWFDRAATAAEPGSRRHAEALRSRSRSLVLLHHSPVGITRLGNVG